MTTLYIRLIAIAIVFAIVFGPAIVVMVHNAITNVPAHNEGINVRALERIPNNGNVKYIVRIGNNVVRNGNNDVIEATRKGLDKDEQLHYS